MDNLDNLFALWRLTARCPLCEVPAPFITDLLPSSSTMPGVFVIARDTTSAANRIQNSEAMQGAPLTDQPPASYSARDIATAVAIAILILLVVIACTIVFFIIRRRGMREARKYQLPRDIESKAQSLIEKSVTRKPLPISKTPSSPYRHPNVSEDDLFRSYLERPLPAHPVH